MIKVYLASRFEDIDIMREWAAYLNGRPSMFRVTSRWIDTQDQKEVSGPGRMDVLTDKRKHEIARQNYSDILNSHVFVIYNPEHAKEHGTGGRHIETGFAIANSLPVIIVGVQATCMQYHEQVREVVESFRCLEDLSRVIERVYVDYWQEPNFS